MLAAHQGDVCSKEQLLSTVWPRGVDEANLTQTIYRLRRTLAARDKSVVLETVPRRGYRLTINGHRRIQLRRLFAAGLVVAAIASIAVALVIRGIPKADAIAPSYVAGYYLWSTARSIADVRKSIALFQNAIAEEPKNALGYAGLADAYLSLAMRDADLKQSAADARTGMEAARKAIAIGPSSSEAHAAYGQGQVYFGDARLGERELQRAVQLDPESAEARTWYGELLMSQGKINASIIQLRAAFAANSMSTVAGDDLALLSYLRRDFSDAVAYAKQSLTQAPDDTQAMFVLALTEGQLHKLQAAERTLQQLSGLKNSTAALRARALLSLFYLEDGKPKQAGRESLAAKRTLQNIGIVNNPSTIISIAAALALQRQADTAFAWLGRIDPFTRRLFADDARLDLLRKDHRFSRWLNS